MTSKKKIIGTMALALMVSAGVAGAQTTTDTVTTDTAGGAVSTTTTGLPGTPNTGVGGDAAENMLLLGSSALAAIAGAAYLLSRRSPVR